MNPKGVRDTTHLVSWHTCVTSSTLKWRILWCISYTQKKHFFVVHRQISPCTYFYLFHVHIPRDQTRCVGGGEVFSFLFFSPWHGRKKPTTRAHKLRTNQEHLLPVSFTRPFFDVTHFEIIIQQQLLSGTNMDRTKNKRGEPILRSLSSPL